MTQSNGMSPYEFEQTIKELKSQMTRAEFESTIKGFEPSEFKEPEAEDESMAQYELKATITEFMETLVNNELTPEDRAAIAQSGAQVKRKNIQNRKIGAVLLGTVGIGVFALVKNYDIASSFIQNVADFSKWEAGATIITPTVIFVIIAYVAGTENLFSNYDNAEFKRKTYMKYESARNLLANMSQQKTNGSK